jgi:uncharacterized protein (TIGR02266 family)
VTSPGATITAAKQGRSVLATALLSLQTAGVVDPRIERAVEATASASSALYNAEQAAATEEAAISFIHGAVEALQRALADVSLLRPQYAALEVAASSLATTLALLYPVLKHSLRQRRARLPAGGLSDSDAEELRAMAGFPSAPSPTGHERRPSIFRGDDRRRGGESPRVFVEVEIGLTTESHIYTGLSLDVSTGGLFVATYEAASPGTAVSLHFVLPDGFVVNAEGVVRWTREATSDAPPGMGVAFVQISVDALNHIAAFCASRPPLYFDE